MSNIVEELEVDELDRFFVGRELPRGWRVESVRSVQRDAPASCRTYVGHGPNGNLVFIKVLDPRGRSSLVDQKSALDDFAYESALLEKCGTRNMRRVIRGLDADSIRVEGILPIQIQYLVFEWADSDARSQLGNDELTHTRSSLRWLHHMATALHELHFSNITHQDLKPANVLVMPERDAKLGDLGSASDSTQPRLRGDMARDPTWAPPEYLFNAMADSFDSRCAADMYQLGSLAVFLFSSVGLTALMARHMPHLHHWSAWQGTYKDALPYLRTYYNNALEDYRSSSPEWVVEDLVVTVRQLTDPDPDLRGHPRNRAGFGLRYGFERFVSAFNVLAEKAAHRR